MNDHFLEAVKVCSLGQITNALFEVALSEKHVDLPCILLNFKMIKSKITTGKNLEVHESGSLVLTEETVNFTFQNSLTFRIVFKNDQNDVSTRFQGQIINEKLLELNLFNFNSSLPAGNTDPVEVGYLQNRRLFINFSVFSIGPTHKILHYSFFLGDSIHG